MKKVPKRLTRWRRLGGGERILWLLIYQLECPTGYLITTSADVPKPIAIVRGIHEPSTNKALRIVGGERVRSKDVSYMEGRDMLEYGALFAGAMWQLDDRARIIGDRPFIAGRYVRAKDSPTRRLFFQTYSNGFEDTSGIGSGEKPANES
jgi:hypothetical protein